MSSSASHRLLRRREAERGVAFELREAEIRLEAGHDRADQVGQDVLCVVDLDGRQVLGVAGDVGDEQADGFGLDHVGVSMMLKLSTDRRAGTGARICRYVPSLIIALKRGLNSAVSCGWSSATPMPCSCRGSTAVDLCSSPGYSVGEVGVAQVGLDGSVEQRLDGVRLGREGLRPIPGSFAAVQASFRPWP